MRRVLLGLMLGLAAITAAMAEVKIEGETKTKPYEFVRLQATPEDPTAGYSWKVFDKDRKRVSAKSAWVKDGKLVFVAPPGTYTVELIAFRYDEKAKRVIVEEAETTVTIEGKVEPGPGPGPNPPDPKPDPNPDDGTIETAPCHVVVIEETEDATAKRGKWLRDAGLQGYVKAKSWKVFIRDKDVKDQSGQTPKDIKPYLDRVAGKTLPILFVVNSTGKVRYEGKLPATPADLLALFKKIGG